jgi:tetratricopeptide (TPR) repeat protein
VVTTLLVGVLVATGLLFLLAIARRWQRDEYLRRLDRLREAYAPVVSQLVANQLAYPDALSILNSISTPDRLAVLELLCLEKKPSHAALPLIRGLCEDLGLVAHWQENLRQRADAVPWRAALAQLNNAPAAIQQYKHLLEAQPTDRDAQMELAQLLSAAGRHEDAAKLYQSVLAQAPEDTSALEGLAYVRVKLKRWQQARPLFETLAGKQAGRVDYQVELARLHMSLKDYAAAREVLVTLLATHPHEEDARAQLAQLELAQNHFRGAARQFDLVLKQNPNHVEARLGRARVAYYLNDLSTAQRLAAGLVAERPEDFDAIFLLAEVEHARRHRARALDLVQQAKQLVPDDPEAAALEKRIERQASFRLRTTASYAREIGVASELSNRAGTGSEDLRMAGFGTTLEFAYLPSNSPAAGIRGAVGPAQWLYRQDTQLTSSLILRGGVGLARFGPGRLENIPGQTEPIATATFKPVGFAGFSYAPTQKYSLDLEAARSAVFYTPTAVRLGTMENRFGARLNYFFNRRTELHFEYFFATYASILYNHVRIVNYSPVRGLYADHDQAHGGTVTFVRNVMRGERFRWDAGYEGAAYGFTGVRRQVWLGFFSPSFYQRHQFTSHVAGKIWKPLGYDFSGGIGLQQVEQGRALTRAMTLSPALTCQVNPRLTLSLGYTHYNSAQTLGAVRGDAVRLTREWSF